MAEFDYDLFVIGAGSGGVRASRIAASLGARVGVAEERYLGGTCVNAGCIPKKLFSYAAHYGYDFQDARGFGWELPQEACFNWEKLREATATELKRLNGIYAGMLSQANVDVFESRATVLTDNRVQVGAQQFKARHILIATGAWPTIPEFPGSDLALNSNDMFTLEQLPDRMIIVGAGYIAVEFAGIMAGLGVHTTLVHRGDNLLRGFDQDIRDLLCGEIRKYCDLRLNSNVISLKREDDGQLRARFDNGEDLLVGAVMFATGRHPNSAGIGLEGAGVKLAGNGAVVVDEHFQTSAPGIYAVGDVIDRMALTPVALAEGQLLAQRLFGTPSREMSYTNIPTAVFSHPNIGTVGMTEEQARQSCERVAVYKSRFTPLRHTLSGNGEKTFLKMLVDRDSDRVLGLHMLGPDAGEIIQGLAVAMNAGATKRDFDTTLGIHPTTAEEFVTMRTPEPF